jgi:hypothetical protein
MESLISKESIQVVNSVRTFLESVIIEMEIQTEIEKKNAVTLGNELQKKWKTIEDTRKKEKGIWDAKSKAVQDEFKPTLDLIAKKKGALSTAITAYDRKLEIERQKRQKELEEVAEKERNKLEAFAGKREERLKMYQDKLEECKKRRDLISNDTAAWNLLTREIAYYTSKVNEFTEKASESRQQAASIVTPIYQPETSTTSAGTRTRMVARIQITDMKKFVAWCIEKDEYQFLQIDEMKLKQRVKEKEGHIEIPGADCSYLPETGFSGR